jgi:ParB family transcriptional regulator, chromosome partitioning protein
MSGQEHITMDGWRYKFMTARKRGLGKGLDALLGTGGMLEDTTGKEKLRNIPVAIIKRGQFQPRKTMNPDALKDLADSIRAQGVVQPILVRPVSSNPGQYEIIAGERRWRAAQMAGLHEVPALVREIPDHTAACIALIENIQREDLNPLEEAKSFARLIKEFGMTHETISEAVGRSRSAVTNFLRLLELHKDVQEFLQSGSLDMGHARAIVALPLEHQAVVARRVVKSGLSVRETEQLVQGIQKSGSKNKKTSRKLDPNIRKLQDELSEKLGTNVSIKHGAKGKGTLSIRYNSLKELDGILSRIK